MSSIPHDCPLCGAITCVHQPRIAHNSPAHWACEQCGSNFEIRTFFTTIDGEGVPPMRSHSQEGADRVSLGKGASGTDGRQVHETQRLLEIYGEILFLRDRLATLEAEAEWLKEELQR